MRIAMGIHSLTPRGGQEDHCLRIAEALVARGHGVTIFSRSDAGELKVPVVQMPAHRLLSNHARTARFAAEFLERTKTRFDRTVTFQPIPGADVVFIGEDVRNRPDAGFFKRLTPRFRTLAAIEEAVFGAGSRVRVAGYSAVQMRAFTERYPESASRIAVLPPTLRPERCRPELRESAMRAETRRSLGLGEGEKAWLWIGLQPEIKGLDRVLDALATEADATLLIAGLSADHHKAKITHQQIAKLGLADRVRFIGYLSGERFPAVLAAVDVLAHPARREASGSTILEALVNGLPVVTTDVCGFAPHVEKAGAGIVIPSPFDPHAFAQALRKACGSEGEAFSRRGIAYGGEPFLYSGIDVACDLIEADAWPAGTGRP